MDESQLYGISLAELREKAREVTHPRPSLFLATPCRGDISVQYFNSFLQTQRALTAEGIGMVVGVLSGQSVIHKARNRLADQFLATDATHILWIDSDMKWRGEDVVRLLSHNVPFVGGAGPIKSLELTGLNRYVGNIDPKWCGDPSNGLIGATDVGCGFTLVHRSVFEAVAADSPLLENPDNVATGRERRYYDYGVYGNREFSEDFTFARKYQAVGGTVYIDTMCQLGHYGAHLFTAPTLHEAIMVAA